jgi:pSer/pThr/pTyr-binding forkhead associated (FHA) protein
MAKAELSCMLRVVKGQDEGTEYPLAPDQAYVIGRTSSAQIQVSDPTVSHEHASVENVGGIWFVSDAGSRHGTYVNKKKITGRKALFDRDVIRVGKSLIEFREYEPLAAEDARQLGVGLKPKGGGKSG